VQQAFNWDCGLACVLMVLRTLGVDCCDGIAHLEKLCRTKRFLIASSKIVFFSEITYEVVIKWVCYGSAWSSKSIGV
jgi:hypothetical protein